MVGAFGRRKSGEASFDAIFDGQEAAEHISRRKEVWQEVDMGGFFGRRIRRF
jgi:hypothetical protein